MAPKLSQLISLEPNKAERLDKLARSSGTAKQVLLREAVDDLLAKYGGEPSETYDLVRSALEDARAAVVRFGKRTDEYVWARKCFSAQTQIDAALKRLGDAD